MAEREHGRRDPMPGQRRFEPVRRGEIDQLAGEELAERAATTMVSANVAIPIDATAAANVLSDAAITYADAAEQTPDDESTAS